MITVDFLGQTALCDQQWGNKEAQVHQTVTVKVKVYWKVKIMRIRYTQGGHDQEPQVYCKETKERISGNLSVGQRRAKVYRCG